MNGPDAPVRLLEHNLIDICDLLGATVSLDGTQVVFVRRRPGARDVWSGRLGDWLVRDPASGWQVVSDDEYGRRPADGFANGNGAASREPGQGAPTPASEQVAPSGRSEMPAP